MWVSKENEHDAPYAIPLEKNVHYMFPFLKMVQLDAGYNSFLIHAELWKLIKVQPLIFLIDKISILMIL